LGILLNTTKDAAALIGDKLSLFLNLVNDLRLPSDEIRGEILFVLYKLSISNATPWDNICDNGDVDLLAIGRNLLQLSLEVLLKTQNDTVRLNCIALLLTLAKKGPFDLVLLSNQSSINCVEPEHMQNDYMSLNASLVLFAEAVKGSLLSTNLEVQTGTLDLIFHFLSSDGDICALLQILIDENVADYIFEVLRLSGNNDLVVISSIQVLFLLARSEEKFKEKLAIGFSTLLPVLHYVAEIPFHPVQSHVLQLVWICMVNCSGILSLPQEEQIACTLTAILRSLLYFLYCMPVHSTMKGWLLTTKFWLLLSNTSSSIVEASHMKLIFLLCLRFWSTFMPMSGAFPIAAAFHIVQKPRVLYST